MSIASLTATDESCAGSGNGTATVSAAGGTTPYTYAWSNGAKRSFNNCRSRNLHSVTITDANGCAPATGSITINAAAQPNQANAGPDLVGCVGSFPIVLNGSVTNATGGAWSGGNGSFSGTWPNVNYTPGPADITAGSVTLTLSTTGNTNCPQATDQLVLNLPNSFGNATVSPTDALCNGTATGSASFTPALPGFTYSWSTTPAQTTATATDLAAGNYSVTATDSYGCSTTLSTTIGQPNAIALAGLTSTDESVRRFRQRFRSLLLRPAARQPYSYTWSNGASTASITAGAGTYTVSITDANGCAPAAGSATINAAAQPNQANAGPDLIGCVGSFPIPLNGSVTNATGGSWSGGSGSFSGTWPNVSYAPSAADITAGGVTLTLSTTGNNDCPAVRRPTGHLNMPNSFANATVTRTNAICSGSTTGSAVFAPDPAPSPTHGAPARSQTTANGHEPAARQLQRDRDRCVRMHSITLSTTIGPVAPVSIARPHRNR